MGHTKKAVKIAKNKEKGLGEKFREILIEVAIIIFAVSFAAFIERTREHYKERSEAKEFLIGLNSDIKNELAQVNQAKSQLNEMIKSYTRLQGYKIKDVDSLEKYNIKESFFIPKLNNRPLNGRYEGFKSSGKIQTIENDSLRNDILKLYQEDIPFIDFSESAFNTNQGRVEELLLSGSRDGYAKETDVLRTVISPRGKLVVGFSLSYATAVVTGYDKMIKQAQKVQKEIEKEYGE